MDNTVNRDTVRGLLEKYFGGETSAQEERALREYFSSASDLPDDLEYARTLFGYFAQAGSQKSERVFEIPANTHSGRETLAKTRTNSESSAKPHRIVSRRRLNRLRIWVCGASAAVIAAAAILFTTHDDTVYCYINGEPVTDYELAYAYTQGALGLIKNNIRKPGEYLVAVGSEEPFAGFRYLELFGTLADGIF